MEFVWLSSKMLFGSAVIRLRWVSIDWVLLAARWHNYWRISYYLNERLNQNIVELRATTGSGNLPAVVTFALIFTYNSINLKS